MRNPSYIKRTARVLNQDLNDVELSCYPITRIKGMRIAPGMVVTLKYGKVVLAKSGDIPFGLCANFVGGQFCDGIQKEVAVIKRGEVEVLNQEGYEPLVWNQWGELGADIFWDDMSRLCSKQHNSSQKSIAKLVEVFAMDRIKIDLKIHSNIYLTKTI